MHISLSLSLLYMGNLQNFLILLFLSLTLSLPLCLSLNQEGLYLQRVKQSLSDPTGSLSTWSDRDATPCNWTGITCDNSPSSSVVSVNLTTASLSGPFPSFLCRLRSLSSISLSNNSINMLPATISTCQNLTLLDLSQNLLVGPIPPTLSDLPNLRYLNLDGNNFSGDIPASLGNFQQLETLILSENLLSGTVSAVLGNITSLKWLQLAYNPFAPSRLAPELGNLTNLEYLWLAGCNLVGEIPESFAKLSSLTNLDVSINQLTGSIPNLIFQLKNVVQIELYQNSFTGTLPAGWSNLTALRRFDASTNKLTGTIPDDLCELPLESLNLQENQLVGLVPESIAKSPNLQEFKLFNNQLTGSLPSQLGVNSPLQILDVSENMFSGEIPENLCAKWALVELVMIDNLFSGNIPVGLGKCRSLSRVRLRSNRLFGEVPAEFWGLPHVYLLDLFNNSFSGNISHMISGARNLSILMISKNKFSGSIPDEIGLLGSLIEFSANENEFSGEIPGPLVQLSQLGKLDLSNNELSEGIPVVREIPDDIGRLPGLNYLDLSGNYFSGKIPLGLQNLKLSKLNLSSNRLSGKIPPLYAQEVYRNSFVGNPGLCDDLAGLCPPQVRDRNQGYVWILGLIFAVTGTVLIVGVVWFVWKYWNIKESREGIILSKWRSFHKLGFSEFEIFDCLNEDNVIGSGASGKVYKVVLSNGEVVAVKKLWERSNKDDTSFESADSAKDEFKVEVETLGKIRHKNIVRLWCCCNSGNCKLLVYEYMPNGSLGDLLHSKGALLDWPTRFRIVLDAAEGLSYLHHDCVPPIVHRDVKSNNILLDGEFAARIADFGVAKFVEAVKRGEEFMSGIAGSCGYIAPEYAYTLRVTEKSDIYSFGVVILELVTGRRPIDPEFGEKDLAKWVCITLDQKGVDHVLDPNLDSSFKEQICRVLDIGVLCVGPLPINRPSMRRVVKLLQEAGADNKPKIGKKDGKLSPYYSDEGSAI
ncbi:unnamed protein product [Ilex paraguariensis]|uniref:non-specific serine/threonine protein kinase n=1 Tax=Ilex paraguariensis TaxID=185542 RepID=A0ABC8TQ71_9AQUA